MKIMRLELSTLEVSTIPTYHNNKAEVVEELDNVYK
jgi:hypothetical protein